MSLIVSEPEKDAARMAKIIYFLYLVGTVLFFIFFIPLFAAVVGVVIAYVYQADDESHWLYSHYQFQIRTFWIGFLYVVTGTVLTLVLIGHVILFFWFIWSIARCIKGVKYLVNHQPYPNPRTWML